MWFLWSKVLEHVTCCPCVSCLIDCLNNSWLYSSLSPERTAFIVKKIWELIKIWELSIGVKRAILTVRKEQKSICGIAQAKWNVIKQKETNEYWATETEQVGQAKQWSSWWQQPYESCERKKNTNRDITNNLQGEGLTIHSESWRPCYKIQTSHQKEAAEFTKNPRDELQKLLNRDEPPPKWWKDQRVENESICSWSWA